MIKMMNPSLCLTALLLVPGLTAIQASSIYIHSGTGSSTIPEYHTPGVYVATACTTPVLPTMTQGRGITITRSSTESCAPRKVCPPVVPRCAPVYVWQSSQVVLTSPAFGSSGRRETRTFEQLGHDWARDLRQDIVTWETFVEFVNKSVLHAFSQDREQFRRGFVGTYGMNADAAWDKALQDATNL